MAAEMTAKSSVRITDPNLALNGKKMFMIYGLSGSDTDYYTVKELTTVEGAFLTSTGGTAGAFSIGSSNKITMSNGSTKTWSGLVWGV